MKCETVTKLDYRNKIKSKIDDDVMLENFDAIAIFLIYSQFGAIGRPDSKCILCKTYIFINSNLLSYKN